LDKIIRTQEWKTGIKTDKDKVKRIIEELTEHLTSYKTNIDP
jgi:uncharacterized protein involved in tolerance to divalent cations